MKLLKWLRRAIRRRQSDIIAVMCPTCNHMMNAFEKHQCEIIEITRIEYK
jgi:hypothetical protein